MNDQQDAIVEIAIDVEAHARDCGDLTRAILQRLQTDAPELHIEDHAIDEAVRRVETRVRLCTRAIVNGTDGSIH